jgi:hypothetical protein
MRISTWLGMTTCPEALSRAIGLGVMLWGDIDHGLG